MAELNFLPWRIHLYRYPQNTWRPLSFGLSFFLLALFLSSHFFITQKRNENATALWHLEKKLTELSRKTRHPFNQHATRLFSQYQQEKNRLVTMFSYSETEICLIHFRLEKNAFLIVGRSKTIAEIVNFIKRIQACSVSKQFELRKLAKEYQFKLYVQT